MIQNGDYRLIPLTEGPEVGAPLLLASKVRAAGQQQGQAGRTESRAQASGDIHPRSSISVPNLKEVILLTATRPCKTTLRSRIEPSWYLGFGL